TSQRCCSSVKVRLDRLTTAFVATWSGVASSNVSVTSASTGAYAAVDGATSNVPSPLSVAHDGGPSSSNVTSSASSSAASPVRASVPATESVDCSVSPIAVTVTG